MKVECGLVEHFSSLGTHSSNNSYTIFLCVYLHLRSEGKHMAGVSGRCYSICYFIQLFCNSYVGISLLGPFSFYLYPQSLFFFPLEKRLCSELSNILI